MYLGCLINGVEYNKCQIFVPNDIYTPAYGSLMSVSNMQYICMIHHMKASLILNPMDVSGNVNDIYYVHYEQFSKTDPQWICLLQDLGHGPIKPTMHPIPHTYQQTNVFLNPLCFLNMIKNVNIENFGIVHLYRTFQYAKNAYLSNFRGI